MAPAAVSAAIVRSWFMAPFLTSLGPDFLILRDHFCAGPLARAGETAVSGLTGAGVVRLRRGYRRRHDFAIHTSTYARRLVPGPRRHQATALLGRVAVDRALRAGRRCV